MRFFQYAYVLVVIVASVSCTEHKSNYFVGSDKHWFKSDHYLIGERKGDSILVEGITDDNWACGCFWRNGAELLPLKKCKGDKFEIIEISNDRIDIRTTSNTVFHLSNGNEKQYHLLKNEVTKIALEGQYEDSVRAILNAKIESYVMLSHYLAFPYNLPEVRKMMDDYPSEKFRGEYQAYLDKELIAVRDDAKQKKARYDLLVAGQVKVDSIFFQKFLKQYFYSEYDRRALYLILTTYPELYYAANANEYGDDITYDYGAFTKAEMTAMYCKVKSVEHLSRRGRDLWPFERRGDLECKQIDSIGSDERGEVNSLSGNPDNMK